MTPVKGQSSSRHKGKEIAFDLLTTHDVGEEAVYSELDHSDEEETQCALDSECAPLIDPWYNIHPHFSKVPDDYTSLLLPPSPGRVWHALCC